MSHPAFYRRPLAGMHRANTPVTMPRGLGSSSSLRTLILALVGLCTAVSGGRAHADPPRRVAKALPAPDLESSRTAPTSTVESLLGEADSDGDGRVTGSELE